MPETDDFPSPTTYAVVNTSAYVLVLTLLTCAACWIFRLPWWVGLTGGVVAGVLLLGVGMDRLIPKLMNPITEYFHRKTSH